MNHKLARYCLVIVLARALTSHANPELLVKAEGGPDSQAAHAADKAARATVIRQFRNVGWYGVALADGMTAAEGIALYKGQPGVISVEPNKTVRRIQGVQTGSRLKENGSLAIQGLRPNDPKYSSQWDLRKIGMEEAWATTTGSSNVVVAVTDTGVNYLHPDLAANMWRNPGETGLDAAGNDKATNGIDDDQDGYIDDVFGVNVLSGSGDPMDLGDDSNPPYYHGTACAGVIGAVGNNGLGITGVNWQTSVMAINFVGGAPFTFSTVGFVASFDYILEMKRRGVNIRVVSTSVVSDTVSRAAMDALRACGDANILCVFAAGNEGIDLDTVQWRNVTSDLSHVLTVTGVDQSDALLYNFGRSTVDLAAPTYNLFALANETNYYSNFSGSSAACPHVAGAAALLCAARPELSAIELRTALLGSVDPISSLKGRIVTSGRLNVARALQYITNSEAAIPIVIFASPTGLLTSTNSPIRVLFNQPMDRASVEAAFSITPAVSGTFEWSPDGRQFTFIHSEPFSNVVHTARLTALAKDVQGRPLDGNFDRMVSASDDFVWKFGFPLSNDAFSSGTLLEGTEGSISAKTLTATAEDNEPTPSTIATADYDASVWYRWVAPFSGWVTFDLTQGTGYDSVLAAYTGTNIASLAEVAANSNYGSKTASRMSFPTQAGQKYAIVVGGVWNQNLTGTMGPFTLRWYPTPSPIISTITPPSGYPGQVITLNGTNFTGVSQVLLNGVPVPFRPLTNANFLDLRLQITLPSNASSGSVTVETPHGNVTSTTEVTVLALPTLTVEIDTDDGLILSWPTDAGGFTLQAKKTLGSESAWQAVSLPEVQPAVPGRTRLRDTSATAGNFYRLRR